MRRRLDLAASVIVRPQLLFLDEPTTGLDPRSRNQVWATARGLVDEGVTILLTTQYLEEADQLADRIAMLDRGRVVAEGTAAELTGSLGAEVLRLESPIALRSAGRPSSCPGSGRRPPANTRCRHRRLLARSAEAATSFTMVLMFVPYVSTAFVPAHTMPPVLSDVARYQLLTPIIETMRDLWMGTPPAVWRSDMKHSSPSPIASACSPCQRRLRPTSSATEPVDDGGESLDR